MRAFELITDEIPPLIHTDSGEKAINWMDEFKVSQLAVLKNGVFVGVVSESAILDRLILSDSLDVLFDHLPRPYVNENAHIYDVLAMMSEHKLSIIPVLDENENYLGCTSIFHLMTTLANIGSIKEPGSILVLEINAIDYSMAQIAQIVESNNAKILSSYILSDAASSLLEVTLKINEINLTRIILTFERYDYKIKASYQAGVNDEDVRWKYDALMNFMKF